MSVDFLVRLGIGSVSCSPFRVPLARLAVAQSLLACGRVLVENCSFDFGAGKAAGVGSDPDTSDCARSTAIPSEDVAIEIDEALVLHVVRVRGFVSTDDFVESIGVHPSTTLESLLLTGLVRHIEARDIYALTPTGRQRHESLLDSLTTEAVRDRLAVFYESFLALNEDLKQLCTTWQMRDDHPNDHNDADYDRRCLTELALLAKAAELLLEDLTAIIPRFSRYRVRLIRAAERVASGDTTCFSGVACGSFHDVWMELHEDLVLLQRIDRVDERSF